MKASFYLEKNTLPKSKVKFNIDSTHFLQLSMLIIEHANIDNKSNQVDKNHTLSCSPYICEERWQDLKLWPLFKTAPAQNDDFD